MLRTELSDLGLTKRQANAFAKKNIDSAEKLLSWFPIRYIDNSVETGLHAAFSEKHAVIVGQLTDCILDEGRSSGRKYLALRVHDRKSNAYLRISIFGQLFLFPQYRSMIGREVIVAGKLMYDPRFGFSMYNPDLFSSDIENNLRIVPVFSKIAGIPAKTLEETVRKALNHIPEDAIADIATKEGLLPLDVAYRTLLAPSAPAISSGSLFDARHTTGRYRNTDALIDTAKQRFTFNKLFYLAAMFTLRERLEKKDGPLIVSSSFAEQYTRELPYQLTSGQQDVYNSIRNDMLQGKHLRALVQGDVGCGKTEVAVLSMLLAAENGFQAVMMAPTQILAEQHYAKLQKVASRFGLSCVYIGGGKVKKAELEQLSNGTASLIVGTHALLSDRIQFRNLGLIIVDEEHKFGVQQRAVLEKKASVVDYISMTATPIPRTLANALYGSAVKVFSIHEKPGNRKDVITYYDNGNKIDGFMSRVLASGQQCYVVCPMIQESDENSSMAGILSTHEAYEHYLRKFGYTYEIRELTGETPEKETEEILREFRDGKIHVLVSTTVIEVGVDVPNATLIVIHNAERFGLASLHQLRGRVGRGDLQSYCIIQSPDSPNENARLMTICTSNDGFALAEEDMRYLRKSGDIFGETQSGYNQYIESMLTYPDLYRKAMEYAQSSSDETLSHFVEYIQSIDGVKLRTRRNS